MVAPNTAAQGEMQTPEMGRIDRSEARAKRIADGVRRALVMIVRLLEKEFDLPPLRTTL